MKYFKDVKCIRLPYDKLKISWKDEISEVVKVFLFNEGCETLLSKVKDCNEIIFQDPNKLKRSMFILKSENYHQEIVEESLIPFTGTHNFRDIGGYKSEDGRRVKWNTFYRSDKLSGFTAKDIDYFRNLEIKTILDFRPIGDIRVHRDPKISGVKYINISALTEVFNINDSSDVIELFNRKYSEKFDIKSFIIDIYKSIAFNNYAYRELLDCIEKEDNLPIVFHCTAGKDLTGFASALILSILGVPEKIIMEDYVASNFYRRDINKKIRRSMEKNVFDSKKIEILDLILEVKEEFLKASFESIKDKYGSIENYLEKEYGITKKKRKELKSRFLY